MSAENEGTPRVFLIRHGETEWSKNGRYTGITDLPLLPEGVEKVQQTASVAFGAGRLVDPSKIGLVVCSPRRRARQTLGLFLDRIPEPAVRASLESKTTTTEDIAEWGYGDYEGLLTHQIRELRRSRGLDGCEGGGRPWNAMLDGCEGPGGELPADVTRRVDRVISRVTTMQRDALDGRRPCDVVIVAHGHILRAFAKRWLGFAIDDPVRLEFQFEPGSVCGLSYAHRNIDERVLLAGMRWPVPSDSSSSS
ncbi:hypothetical protein PV08_08853 [Exophiala spinifera]|uniref:Phosphoglycerate mutase n=1 Tax=Exophiala spinifera TaxID=91928 RepID=A0A0D1ZLF9_9EURO|nr:uncharacterized protein PV08_08853 [Exophiala spinifera]KIW13662.1 hypothetical protein PV08_08853 [Exophiala spinifera]